MGTKFSTTAISGFNASPPSDDGSQTEANRTTWKKHKDKLADPVKTLAESINTKMVAHVNEEVLDKGAAFTTTVAEHKKTINVTGAFTQSLGDASTMGTSYIVTIKNSHTAAITVDLDTGADTLDGNAGGSTTVAPQHAKTFITNSGADGYHSLDTNTFDAITVTGTTNSTSGSTGSINTAGGIGAVKDIVTDANLKVGATAYTTKGADIASANDTVLLADGNYNDITGTTDINGLTDGVLNETRKFHFDAAVLLKHNTAASAGFSSLFLPNAVDYTTVANDELDFTYDGALWMLTGSNFYSAVAIAVGVANAPSILGLDFLTEIVLSSDATAEFTANIDSTYDEYIFTFIDVVPTSDNASFLAQFSVDNGSTWITTSTYLEVGTTYTSFRIIGVLGIGSASGEGGSGQARLYNPSSTTQRKRIRSELAFTRDNGDQDDFENAGENTGLTAINAIKFYFSAGNLASGTIRMYGRRIQ